MIQQRVREYLGLRSLRLWAVPVTSETPVRLTDSDGNTTYRTETETVMVEVFATDERQAERRAAAKRRAQLRNRDVEERSWGLRLRTPWYKIWSPNWWVGNYRRAAHLSFHPMGLKPLTMFGFFTTDAKARWANQQKSFADKAPQPVEASHSDKRAVDRAYRNALIATIVYGSLCAATIKHAASGFTADSGAIIRISAQISAGLIAFSFLLLMVRSARHVAHLAQLRITPPENDGQSGGNT